jgi:hypothetical protein
MDTAQKTPDDVTMLSTSSKTTDSTHPCWQKGLEPELVGQAEVFGGLGCKSDVISDTCQKKCQMMS